MIPQLEPRTLLAVHLRSPSRSGGKDWVGSITAESEIHTFWGKTGQVNQHAVKKGSHQQLLQLIRSKYAKGYALVDEYRDGSGWSSQAETCRPEGKETNENLANGRRPVIKPPVLLRDDGDTLAWDF
jgi:hypothetical protein